MATFKKVEQGTEEEDGSSYVRLIIPSRGRSCAPCCNERNVCCGGKKTVHLRNDRDFQRPAVPWLRVRISYAEWADFVAALDAANLEGTVKYGACLLCPCTFPGLCFQPLCCCAPYQYALGQEIRGENAINLTIAKYNRYLFLPRNIVVRKQFQKDADGNVFNFLRLDFVPYSGPLDETRLADGLKYGTQHYDLEESSRFERMAHILPCPTWRQCSSERLIPTPTLYFASEPEINDGELAQKFEQRNRELLGTDPDGMLRV